MILFDLRKATSFSQSEAVWSGDYGIKDHAPEGLSGLSWMALVKSSRAPMKSPLSAFFTPGKERILIYFFCVNSYSSEYNLRKYEQAVLCCTLKLQCLGLVENFAGSFIIDLRLISLFIFNDFAGHWRIRERTEYNLQA